MTIEPVLSGTVVPSPGRSVRDVRSRDWDQGAAWDAAVEFWLKSKPSQHSRDAYRRDIALWHEWCDSQGVPLDDPRRADVDAWRDELAGKPATIARRLAAVSSFYDYWLAEDVVTRNPAARATRPKVSPDPVSIALTRADAAAIATYLRGIPDLRPGVIYRMLTDTGMRVGELTGARVDDLAISGGHHVLAVTRKGGQRQLLPIAGDTRERLTAYLDGRTDGYILYVQRSERRKGDGQMDRSYVRQLLRRIAREAGLPREVWDRMHPHVLRHSAATILAADGVPVHEIQRLLGHASLGTTQRYIHHAESLDKSPVYRMASLISQ